MPERFRCCKHCTQDPAWHRANAPDMHLTPCITSVAKCDDGGDLPAPEYGIDLTYDEDPEEWCPEHEEWYDHCPCYNVPHQTPEPTEGEPS